MSEFHYDNLASLEIDKICSANHASLKNFITTAPENVRDAHPTLPRAVYKLLAIVLSLREKLRQDVSPQNVPVSPLDSNADQQKLEELLAFSFEELQTRANDDLAALVDMIHAALRADNTLEPKEFTESDPFAVANLVLKWQLDATKRALLRRETLEEQRVASVSQAPDPEPPMPLKRANPMDITQDSDPGLKRQKVLRVAGVPTGEHDEES